MFDLSRLGDSLSDLAGQAASANTASLSSLLEQVGIDPGSLQGLGPEQVQTLLAEHGLDPSHLDLSAIGGLVGDAPQGILGALRETLGVRDL